MTGFVGIANSTQAAGVVIGPLVARANPPRPIQGSGGIRESEACWAGADWGLGDASGFELSLDCRVPIGVEKVECPP